MRPKFSLELGMPHLGRNNLSESALFKAIGNDRWKSIEQLGGKPTSLIEDDGGSRLYATFFFLEVHATPDRPLAAYGENDRLDFDRDLSHFGRVYLDGRHSLEGDRGLWVRSSNVFIYQERGPAKLSVSIPANVEYGGIVELAAQPDSLGICRRARLCGSFRNPEPDDLELFPGERVYEYQLDIDRDMNGAGLVYFANFISFLDSAERCVLASLENPVPLSVLDARSTYWRRIGYYGNAHSTDRLVIRIRARARALRSAHHGRLIDMGFDYRIARSSDDKEIVISSSRKVSPMPVGSAGEVWFEAIAASRRAGAGDSVKGGQRGK